MSRSRMAPATPAAAAMAMVMFPLLPWMACSDCVGARGCRTPLLLSIIMAPPEAAAATARDLMAMTQAKRARLMGKNEPKLEKSIVETVLFHCSCLPRPSSSRYSALSMVCFASLITRFLNSGEACFLLFPESSPAKQVTRGQRAMLLFRRAPSCSCCPANARCEESQAGRDVPVAVTCCARPETGLESGTGYLSRPATYDYYIAMGNRNMHTTMLFSWPNSLFEFMSKS